MNLLSQDLVRDEGLRLKPYKCTAGKVTIGVGRNLDDVGITTQEALSMLDRDMKVTETELYRNLPFVKEFSEPRQRALANMLFNLGTPKFMNFKKMISCLKRKDFEGAAAEALDSTWATQVGARADRIAELIRNG